MIGKGQAGPIRFNCSRNSAKLWIKTVIKYGNPNVLGQLNKRLKPSFHVDERIFAQRDVNRPFRA